MKKLFILLVAAVLCFGSMFADDCTPKMVTDLRYYETASVEDYAMYVAYTRVPGEYNPNLTKGAWLYAPYEIGASYMDVHSYSTEGLDQYSVRVGDVYFIDLQAIKIGAWRIQTTYDDFIDEWWYYFPEKSNLNCVEAAVRGSSVSKNNEYDGYDYYVEGYVTKIETAWSNQYQNISFWMADNPDCRDEVIMAYRAENGDDFDYIPSVGDKVEVRGHLTKYGSHAQIKAGCKYFSRGSSGGGGGSDPITPSYTILSSCAEAANAAMSVSANNELYNNGQLYSVDGYVTKIQSAWSAQYNNISFWIGDTKGGDNVIEAFRAKCNSANDAPKVGDKVTVYGQLTKYNTTPEFAAGCEYIIHHSEDTNAISEPTPIDSLLYNEPFNANIGDFSIEDVNLDGLDYVWKWANANYGMKASAYVNNTNHATESWLISPAISLQNATDIVLAFEHALNKGTANNLRVKISTNSGSSWSDLNVPKWPAGNNWDFVSTSLSLDGYADQIVQIAFVYKSTSSDCPTWEIKNLSVTGKIHQSEDVETIRGEINNSSTRKILCNGQIFIQRGDKIYTLQGQEIK